MSVEARQHPRTQHISQGLAQHVTSAHTRHGDHASFKSHLLCNFRYSCALSGRPDGASEPLQYLLIVMTTHTNMQHFSIEYKTCSRTCQISTYGLSLGNSSCLRSHSPPIVSSQSTNLDAPKWDPTLQLVAFVTCLIPSSSHSTTTVAACASFLRIKVLR